MNLSLILPKSSVSATLITLLFSLAPPLSAHAGDTSPLPVVFVHGGAGSAAQYETQALRWSSNRYPNVVTGIDRTSSSGETIQLQLDAFFDEVMAATGDKQIYVIAHSLGVAIMNDYLNSSPERTARVAKYIGIDSQSAGTVAVCPGTPAPVACKGIYRVENVALTLGTDNVYLEAHGHTQAVTSEASFIEQYRFLAGREPETTLVLPEPPRAVEIAGKVINFPANTGLEGSTLQLWEVYGATGARKHRAPTAEIAIGASGEFGPIAVEGGEHYEFVVLRSDVDYIGHAYYQPFLRDDYLIRLLATPPDAPTVQNTARSPDHTAAVLIRYKEWWSDQGEASDRLWALTRSRSWDADSEPPAPRLLDLFTNPSIAARADMKISLHVHDANADKTSSLESIPFFASQAFQTGIDAWLPAADPPDGTIWFLNAPRGDYSKLQLISVPNWSSEKHRVGVQFNDYAQDIGTWEECWRVRPSPCAGQRFTRGHAKWRNWLDR